ncbi:hypothetical protein RKE30_26550 [Streptomyces sp. Li-HN-5-11]|uniref:hypothetical protein n=1 Tax=Streptomyces sp. Li-HN-5-11 TaxID=3075432 RepID=UPI0028A7CD43|nr:hypothetical protein [Streptomyces sp. Li-HN-5-11]WNM33694.1 hypothetical protein RKE30_26550 [Streptomyces sp. Li-HN-5-11]
MIVAIEAEGQHWTVKADTFTAGSGRRVADTVNDAIRTEIIRLIDAREVDFGAYTGPDYFMMPGVRDEERARELAAALHAALYEDLEPLSRAVPPAS